MRNPEIAAIDGDVSVIITEGQVKKHTALRRDDSQRQPSFEDCCTYCDVHHNKRLSAGKHSLIEAWTSNVNENMAQSGARPVSGSTQKNAPKHTYSPPGQPDVDKGFRRIQKPMDMRKQTSVDGNQSRNKGLGGYSKSLCDFSESQLQRDRTNLSHRVISLSQHYFQERSDIDKVMRVKSANSAKNMDTDTDRKSLNHRNLREVDNTNGITEDPHNQTSGGAAMAMDQKKSLHIEIPSVNDSKYIASELISDRTGHTQLGTRTTSNRLLNMVSIDDAFQRHRGTLATTSPWIGPKLVDRDVMYCLSHREQERINRLHQHSPLYDISEGVYEHPKSPGDRNIQLEVAMATSSQDNQNGAVVKGFENLERATEATNNTAYTGLYKFDESCRQPLNTSKGTKRFQRMNRNLQQMVEAFHLHGTPLSRKIRRRKDMGEGNESIATNSRPASESSQASYKFTSTPKFKVGKRVGGQRVGPGSDENSTTEDGRESFLEMIMDMDQKKGKEPVRVHTNLYV